MLKHRGFPGRLPSSDFQFVIRRANKDGATPLIERKRYADRRPADKRADAGFMAALWNHFGEEPFERGNLDAGRLSWLFAARLSRPKPPLTPKITRLCCASMSVSRRSVFPKCSPQMARRSSGMKATIHDLPQPVAHRTNC